MDREAIEARLAHLQQQYQQAEARRNVVAQELDRLNRALVMLEGGIAEVQFLLAQAMRIWKLFENTLFLEALRFSCKMTYLGFLVIQKRRVNRPILIFVKEK